MNDKRHLNERAQWDAVSGRDAAYDGRFYYGVLTTGVFCRPSCPSRRPRRENVRFFDSLEQARLAGLRPCRRCRPEETAAAPTVQQLVSLCRYIDRHPDESLTLAVLGERAGLSVFQVHRLFKSFLGVTPKDYIDQSRLRELKLQLRASTSVTDAIYEAGFESISAVYGRLDLHLGMTPKRYRQGGQGVDISFAIGETPLGRMMIGATDRGVCYLQFGDSELELLEQLAAEYPNAAIAPMNDAGSREFKVWMGALGRYFAGGAPKPEVPVDIRGTAFQKKVWDFLRSIPDGDVMSYTEVAAGIGSPNAARAVAGACAANRIGVLVPCHRVIRGDGSLGGYRWGLSRKRTLLDMERNTRAQKRDR